MSKIVGGLTDALASARCEHVFVPISGPSHRTGSVVARCHKCECRFTAWPDTKHYDEIAEAIRKQATG